jgi:signal transduction histidine kinase
VELTIADNGKGLPPGPAEDRGMGLIGMRARARGAGGGLTFHSAPGKGLTIEVVVAGRGARNAKEDPHPVGG